MSTRQKIIYVSCLLVQVPESVDKELNRVKQVYSFWGKAHVLYDAQDIITFLGCAKTIRSTAVKRIGLRKGDTVVEVACGSGRNFPYLVEAVGGKGTIIGFDYSKDMLDAAKQLCRKRGWDNTQLIQGDAAKLEIPNKDVDGVLSILGISAVPGWEKALQRCHTVLRCGGKLVVCDARLFCGWLKFLNPIVKLIYSTCAAWDPSKKIPEKMKEIFGNVDIEQFNFGTFYIAVSTKRSKGTQ